MGRSEKLKKQEQFFMYVLSALHEHWKFISFPFEHWFGNGSIKNQKMIFSKKYGQKVKKNYLGLIVIK